MKMADGNKDDSDEDGCVDDGEEKNDGFRRDDGCDDG